MTGNDFTHDMQMVVASDWQTFFADLAQRHQGQLVSVEVGRDVLIDRRPDAQVPLQGLAYDRHKGVSISVGSGTTAETHSVEAPDLVWAAHDEHGNLVAVEIIGRDGGRLILHLGP
jgi:hypothetical protein